mmetsp:Transcript_15138/g.17284  ORF Transcript_15138/g.17284 Transcript_15138/m.17284 type:complete len:604 (-) Transcript_15138:242-2053(-)
MEDQSSTVAPMAKFNPSLWLNRARLLSNSSLDFSTTESLAGLNYVSHSSIGSAANMHPSPEPYSREGYKTKKTTPNTPSMPAPSSADHHHRHDPSPEAQLLREWVHEGKKNSQTPVASNQRNWLSPGRRKSLENSNNHNSPSRSPSRRKHNRHLSMPTAVHNAHEAFRRKSIDHGHEGCGHGGDHYDTHDEVHVGDNVVDLEAKDFSIEVRSRDNSPDNREPRLDVASFENGSCISGLSMDETQCDDGRTYKYLDAANESHHTHRFHRHIDYRYDPRDQQFLDQRHRRRDTKGRDFGDAFDHLVKPDPDDESHCYRTTMSHGYRKHGGHTSHGYSHNLMSARPKPLHNRAQSDTMAFRPRTQGSASSTHHYNVPTQPKTLSAHASLRDRLQLMKKPQILSSRSTSNTVQSSSNTSATSTSNSVSASTQPNPGVVWNGQPIDHIVGCYSTPPRPGARPYSSGIYSTGGALSIGSYPSLDPEDVFTSQGESASSTGGSGTGGYVMTQDGLLGTRQRRIFHSSAPSRFQIFDEDDEEERSLKGVPENEQDLRSIESTTSSTLTPGRRRKIIKDELKFMVKKFVPARVRKSNKNKSVTLERSDGCLT